MIKFPCRCSHTFVVEDDQAGASIQCPKCGLLVDVPTLSDLPNLSPDGIYTLSDLDSPHEPDRLNTLYRSFTRDHVDPATGREIDLRTTPEEIRNAHKSSAPDPRVTAPKYDPITGELIRPIQVEGDDRRDRPVAIPMAKSSIAYATPYTQSVPTAWRVALELLMPANVTVMFFVSLAYLVGQFLFATVFLFFLNVPLAGFLLAHYGNVIEDTGPELRDELPRPLRYLAFVDDIWKPFFRMFSAILLCYGPAVYIAVSGLPWVLSVAAALVGSLFLPAVMLTTTTSGTVLNLRPDRVLSLIGIMGARYFIAVALWVVATALHLWTWIGVEILRAEILQGTVNGRWKVLNHALVVYPMIAVAIYLMHYYCWYLGILYRRHQHEFPWVLQRHIPDPNRKPTVRLTPYGPVRTNPPQNAPRHRYAGQA